MFATGNKGVRRLVLERNYLWVYPLWSEGEPEHIALTVEAAVGFLLLQGWVYVPRGLVAAVRAKLKETGKGDEVYG